MNKDSFIKQLVLDWSCKVPNGQPNVKNEYHLSILYNILEKKKVPTEAINEIMNNLRGHKNESITQTDAFRQMSGTMTTGSVYFEPSLQKNEVKSYYYDHEWEKVMESDHYITIDINDIVEDKKTICPKTSEVFLETSKGTLIKKSDIELDEGNIRQGARFKSIIRSYL